MVRLPCWDRRAVMERQQTGHPDYACQDDSMEKVAVGRLSKHRAGSSLESQQVLRCSSGLHKATKVHI